MDLKDLTLREIEQIQSMFQKDSGNINLSGKKILILQRGWVVVGDVSQCGALIKCENARVIRTWGTKKGVGELAENGPLPNTKLDPCGTITVHELAIVFSVDCKEAKWN